MADRQTAVELVFKGRDETAPAVRSAKSGLRELAEAARRRAELESRLNDVQAGRRMREEYHRQAQEVGRLAVELKRVGLAASQDQVSGFRAAREEARRLKQEIVEIGLATARSRGMTGTAGSFSAMDAKAVEPRVDPAAASAALASAQALRDLRDARARNVAAAQELRDAEAALSAMQLSGTSTGEQLVLAQQRVARAHDSVAAAARRAEVAQAAVNRTQGALATRGRGGLGGFANQVEGAFTSRNGRGPLGLRPYEMQNLLYQVNDFFTQIASGTPITQAFAQQIGQVAQLFPGLISGFIRFAPAIGAATVVLAPFVSDLIRLNGERKALKDMETLLSRTGDGAEYQAEALADTAVRLDDYSGSLDDATASLNRFVEDNVAPDYIEAFGRAALDYARVMKVDVADAADMVSKAFTGNADAVLELDDKINFLTDSERKQIEAMKKSGDEAGVRTKAFDLFAERYGKTAEKMEGPWARILDNFAAAWRAFADWVNAIDLSAAVAEINRLLGWVERLSARLPGAKYRSRENVQVTLDDLDREEARTRRNRDQGVRTGNRGQVYFADQRLRDIGTRRQAARNALVALDGLDALAEPDSKDTTTEPTAPRRERSRQPRESEAAREARRKAEAQARFLEDMRAENAERVFQISLMKESERAQVIAEAIREKELEAREVGLELTKSQVAQLKLTVGLEYDLKKQAEANELIDRARLDLARARGEVLTREVTIANALKDAGLDAASTQGRAYADVVGAIWDLEDASRRRALADKAVNDLLGMQSELMRQIEAAEDRGDYEGAERLRRSLGDVNLRLTDAIFHARNLWTAFDGPEAEQALLALDGIEAELATFGQRLVATKADVDGLIEDGAISAWDQFWDGVQRGENALLSLRDAFLSFAADFLRQIARMIAQQLIFNAVQGAMGGGGGGGIGGTIAGFIGGLFGGSFNTSGMKGFMAGVKHDGGIAGAAGRMRMVPAQAFANAMRFHTGGIPGLKPNERAIITEMDEEVLTRDDPRHRWNGGGSRKHVKIVNVLDPSDLLGRALGSDEGEEIFWNFVRQNAGAFKAIVS